MGELGQLLPLKVIGMKSLKCSVCKEEIDSPTEAETDNGICLLCFEELAEDVDDCSPMTDPFELGDIENEERRLIGNVW